MGRTYYSIGFALILSLLISYAQSLTAATVIGSAKFTNNSTYTSGIDGRFKTYTVVHKASNPHPAPGSPKNMIYNNNGSFAGASVLNYSGARLGIGTSNPAGIIDVVKEWPAIVTSNLQASFTAYGDALRYTFRNANGTASSPGATPSGRTIAGFSFRGHDGTNFSSASDASINAQADALFTSTSHPTRMTFFTAAAGSTTSIERLRITSDGKVGVGTTTPRTPFDNASSVAGKGHAKIGSATNYVSISQDYGVRLAGTTTVYDDLRIEPQVRNAGVNVPTFDVTNFVGGGAAGSTGLYSFTDAGAGNEKEIYFSAQMPHAYKTNSAISCHVHWLGQVSDTTAAPRWGLTYTWANIGAAYPAKATIYSTGINITGDGTTDANITAGTHYISSFDDIAPTGVQGGISSILLGRLFRDSANVADTYNAANANCGLMYIDCHIEIDSEGSDNRFSKSATP